MASTLKLFPDGLAIDGMRQWRSGDGAAVEGVLAGVTATGREYRNHYVFVFDVRDGKIDSVHEYCDTAYSDALLADCLLEDSPNTDGGGC